MLLSEITRLHPLGDLVPARSPVSSAQSASTVITVAANSSSAAAVAEIDLDRQNTSDLNCRSHSSKRLRMGAQLLLSFHGSPFGPTCIS